MKLWHDDVRPAPEGWVWARTNAEAMWFLRQRSEPDGRMVVTEVSLDHDMGTTPGDGTPSGYDLVCWMLDNDAVPEKVTVHSWNPPGAQAMASRLAYFGHDVTVQPFGALT